MNRWRICRRCLRTWKRSLSRRQLKALKTAMKQQGRKMNTFYPEWVWHSESTRLCAKHHIDKMVEGSRRRAAEIQAMPVWADQVAIRAVYAEAREQQKRNRVRMDVDHIIPLRGRNVCGLHIASNLRAIPRIENQKKGNKFSDGVGELPAGASSMDALPE